MKARSPTREGFKAILRQPSFGLAEIAWRWSLGFAGVSLLSLAFVEYLDTLPVTAEDMLLLRTRQPALMGRGFEHILRGSALRLLDAGIVLGLTFAVAWVVVASLGRAITVKAVLKYFAEQSSKDETDRPWRLRSLAGLNSFRAAATLAMAVGFAGAILLGGAVSPDNDPSPGSAILVFLTVFTLVNLAWLVVNWFLSLASVFVVVKGEDTFGAIAAAADLCGARAGSIAAVSFWFGLAHFGTFCLMSAVVVFPIAFATVLPGSVVLGGVLLVTLFYFGVADFLYVGRLAAFVYIAEEPDVLSIAEAIPPKPKDRPALRPGTPPESRVDPGELILSDIPLPVVS